MMWRNKGLTWSAVFVEDALGEARENTSHGIDTQFGIFIEKPNYLQAVGEKGAAQKGIRQKDLSYHIHLFFLEMMLTIINESVIK